MIDIIERIWYYVFLIGIFVAGIVYNTIKVDGLPFNNYVYGLFILFMLFAIVDELTNN